MAEKQTFPRIPERNWWAIRDQFKKSLPAEVSTKYLRTLLQLESDKAASNLLPPLKQFGLIDDEGKPTERANLWRNDGKYEEVCKQIIENVYPQELRDLFSGNDMNKDGISNWFQLTSGLGEVAARMSAQMYLLLNDATPKSSSEFISKSPNNKTGDKKPAAKPKGKENGKVPASNSVADIATPPIATPKPIDSAISHAEPKSKNIWGKGMSLHIDLQIHISHQATPEQIDSIFASMAKHLPTIANQDSSDEE